MADDVMHMLKTRLEQLDNERGRPSPAVNLQRDPRYHALARVVRGQMGKASEPPSYGNPDSSSPRSTGVGETPEQDAVVNESHPPLRGSRAAQFRKDRASTFGKSKASSSSDKMTVAVEDNRTPALSTCETPTFGKDVTNLSRFAPASRNSDIVHGEDLIDLVDDDDINIVQPDKFSSRPNQIPARTCPTLPSLFDGDDETSVFDVEEVRPGPSHAKKSKSRAIRASSEATRDLPLTQEGPSPKRRRAPKLPKEVRGERYRAAPSRQVLERMQRCTQRLYLVRRERRSAEDMRLDVMGSNGNLYKVDVSLAPSCTCPDFQGRLAKSNRGPCKHLIFVFLRVFKVARDDPRWWQTRLLPSELKDLLEKAPVYVGKDVEAEESVKRQLTLQDPIEGAGDSSGRRPFEGDCPVCFEVLLEADGCKPEDVTTFCDKCGHNFHKVCLDNWIKAQAETPTCPLCRQPLQSDGKAKSGGYINLASYSTAHERELTLAEMYQDTHQYIGGAFRGRGRGRGRGR